MANERHEATLDTNDIAQIAGVSRRTVQRWRSSGKLSEEPYRGPAGWPYYTASQATLIVRDILPHLTPTEAKQRVSAWTSSRPASPVVVVLEPVASTTPTTSGE